MYVCNKRFFDGLRLVQVFLLNRIFSGTTFQRFAAQIIELLLLPFECKSLEPQSVFKGLQLFDIGNI